MELGGRHAGCGYLGLNALLLLGQSKPEVAQQRKLILPLAYPLTLEAAKRQEAAN